jgi:hypothetical protein
MVTFPSSSQVRRTNFQKVRQRAILQRQRAATAAPTSSIPLEPKAIEKFKSDPNLIREEKSGTIILKSKPQSYVTEDNNGKITKGTYSPNIFVFDKQGNMLRSIRRSIYTSFESRSGRKQQFRVYDKETNVFSGNKRTRTVLDLIPRKSGRGEDPKLLERELYQDGQRVSRFAPQILTPTQLRNLQRKEEAKKKVIIKKKTPKGIKTQLIYNPLTGKTSIVETTPENLKKIEQGRKKAIAIRNIQEQAKTQIQTLRTNLNKAGIKSKITKTGEVVFKDKKGRTQRITVGTTGIISQLGIKGKSPEDVIFSPKLAAELKRTVRKTAIKKEAEKRILTTQEEFKKALFEKQGFDVKISKTGEFILTKKGKKQKTFITKDGRSLVVGKEVRFNPKVWEKAGFKITQDSKGNIFASRPIAGRGGQIQKILVKRFDRNRVESIEKINLAFIPTKEQTEKRKARIESQKIANILKQIPKSLQIGVKNIIKAGKVSSPAILNTISSLSKMIILTKQVLNLKKSGKGVTTKQLKNINDKVEKIKKENKKIIIASKKNKEAKKLIDTNEAKLVNSVILLSAASIVPGTIGGATGLVLTTAVEGFFVVESGKAISKAIINPSKVNITNATILAVPTALGMWGILRGVKSIKVNTNKISVMRKTFRQRILSNNRQIIQFRKLKNVKAIKILKAENKLLTQSLKELSWARTNLFVGKKITIKQANKAFNKLKKSYKEGIHIKSDFKVKLKLKKGIVKKISKVKREAETILKPRIIIVKRDFLKLKKISTDPFIKEFKNLSKANQNFISKVNRILSEIGFNYRWIKILPKARIRDFSINTQKNIIKLLNKIKNTIEFKTLKKDIITLKNTIKRQGINLEIKISDLAEYLSKLTKPRISTLKRDFNKIAKINKNLVLPKIKEFKKTIIIGKQKIKLQLSINKWNRKTKIERITKTRIDTIRRDVGSIIFKYKKNVKFPIEAFLKRLNKTIERFGFSINLVKFKIKLKTRQIVKPRIDTIKKDLGSLAFKYKKNIQFPIERKINIYNKRLKETGLQIKIRKYNTKVIFGKITEPRINILKRDINKLKMLTNNFTQIRVNAIKKDILVIVNLLKKGKGKVTSNIKNKLISINKKLPIQIEIIKVSDLKKLDKPFTGTILKTATTSRKKILLKSIKARAKGSLSNKELTKILRRERALKLEKERMILRKQSAIERKIEQGKQIKSIRPIPTTQGYPFKDKITGKVTYFESRKKWLQAIRQQLGDKKIQSADQLIKNIFKIRKKIKNDLLKGVSNGKILNNFNIVKQQKNKIIIIKKKIKSDPFSPKARLKELKRLNDIEKKLSDDVTQIKQKGQITIQKVITKTKNLKTKLKTESKTKTIQAQKLISKQQAELKSTQVFASKLGFKSLSKTLSSLGTALRSLVIAGAITKQQQITKQKQKQKAIQRVRQTVKTVQKQGQRISEKTKSSLKQNIKSLQDVRTIQDQSTSQKVDQLLRRLSILNNELILKLKPPKKRPPPPSLDEEERKKKLNKLFRTSLKKQKFVYIPDLVARLEGQKATKSERKELLKVGRIFTGLEDRKLV